MRYTDLGLADQGVFPGGHAGELHAQPAAHGAAAAVGADQVPGTQALSVVQVDGDVVVVLVEVDDLTAAPDLRPQLDRVLGQEPFDDGLRHAEDVGVGGIQRGRRLSDPSEPHDGTLPPVLEEPFQQAALGQDLDAADVQTEDADGWRPLMVALQHEHVDTLQPQLGRQHHARRTRPGDDHPWGLLPFADGQKYRGAAAVYRPSVGVILRGVHPAFVAAARQALQE